MASTTLQEKVKNELSNNLLLSETIIGQQAYTDLQQLFQNKVLQLKSMPTITEPSSE